MALTCAAVPLLQGKPARPPLPPLPEVEWWDARLLLDAKGYAGAGGTIAGNVNVAKITIYVEHPVPIEPPAEGPPPAPMPLMLTARVRPLALSCGPKLQSLCELCTRRDVFHVKHPAQVQLLGVGPSLAPMPRMLTFRV